MTVHDYLRRRAKAFVWPIGGLGVLALPFLYLGVADAPYGLLVAAAMFTAQCLLLLAMCVSFRCPRCKKSLASLVGYFGPLRHHKRQVQCCPFCTAKFGEPL